MEIIGKYSKAKVFTDNFEEGVYSQIKSVLSQEYTINQKIRIMPDCHVGKGCVIGFTSTLSNVAIPNLVGVDIGCGILTIELGKKEIDLEEFDKKVRQVVPLGFNIRDKDQEIINIDFLNDLICIESIKNIDRIEKSIGTLGGGNHFIELCEDESGVKYILIHTGSRNLGKQVANHYSKKAIEYSDGISHEKMPKELTYLKGIGMLDYIHDSEICVAYATINREIIAREMLSAMGYGELESFKHYHTIHNYVEVGSSLGDMVVRKGAVSSKEGELLTIPLNMRDGALLCVGKGNPDWNYSAPHGAGRVLSRRKAKELLSMDEYKTDMEGIFSSSVTETTIDESPRCYKDKREILDNINETVEILKEIKPIYNLKGN